VPVSLEGLNELINVRFLQNGVWYIGSSQALALLYKHM
jgi:hypothetical protein